MNDIFDKRNYNGPQLRSQTDFLIPNIKSVSYGENSLKYICPIIWNMIPGELKT